MKAAVLESIDSPLVIKDVGLTELKIGQVLVKVLVSGLCGAQLQEIRGHKGNAKFMPHLLGHEGCGIVQEIGPGVTTVKVGDKVVMHWRLGSGIESPFPNYILDGKVISSGKVTTLSEYSIVSENRLTVVPHDTPNEFCALLGCGLTTALGIIDNEVDLKLGESVTIIGCGGVGLNLIQGAAMRSAYPIIAIDQNVNKRERSLSMKADIFIQTIGELKQHIPDGSDVIVDTTGNSNVLKEISKYLSDRGRLVMVSQPAPGASLDISNASNLFYGNGKSIRATQGGRTNPTLDIPRYIKLQRSGMLSIDKVVSHVFSLEKINDALEILSSGNAGRIIINISKEGQ